MKNENKAKTELINELEDMGKRITELESGERHHNPAEPGKVALRKSILSPEGDMEDLELADILDVQAIQSLMDSFYELARIPMSITDLKGKVLVGVGWQDICTRFHRVHPESLKYCVDSDLRLAAGVPAGESKLYKCRNNMWDAATPIMVGGKHVGNVFSGQFFFDDEPLDYELFRSQARQYGFPEEEYIAALEAVPRLSRESLNTGTAFLIKLAQMFSKLSYSNIELTRSLAERDTLVNSLQVAEEKYRGIFENATIGIFRTTPDGSFLDANPKVARMFGYDSPEELMNTVTHVGTQLYVDPDARERWFSIIEQQDYAGFETEMQKKDGSTCWVHQSARAVRSADGQAIYYEGFSEDITERKRAEEKLNQYRDQLEALVKERTFQLEERNRQLNSEIAERKRVEEALRESENNYRTIFENTGNATLIFEEDTTISLVNAEFENLFHYTRNETEAKKSWAALVLEEDLERLMGYHRLRRTDTEKVPEKYELKVVDRDGLIHNVYMTVAMIPGTKKSVASLMDITPLKEVENALVENEALYRNLFENASIGMFQTSLEGRFLLINKAFATMLGYESPEEVIMTITDASTQIHADPGNRAVFLATLEQQDWFYAEQPYLRRDGSIMIGKAAIRRVLKPDGSIAYLEGIVEDITERKKAEEALLESEKELQIKARNLMEVNTTMKVLLNTMERDQEELQERFLANIKEQVFPYLDKLKKTPLNDVQRGFIKTAEAYLNEIASPFVQKLTSSYLNLTKKEIQIASLVREGKTSKEIAEILNASKRVIEFHRENIRKKLGLNNKKESLAILLRSFS